MLTRISNALCPTSWHLRDGINCYLHEREEVSFIDAFDKCRQMNASLLSIHSIAENNDASYLATGQTIWIGLISNHTASGTSASPAARDEDKEWEWVDDSAVDIQLWSRGGWFLDKSVPVHCTSGCCIAFMVEDGMWDHAACNDSRAKHGYVCRRGISSTGNGSDWQAFEAMLRQVLQMSSQLRHQEETSRVLVTALDSAQLKDMESLERVGEEVAECKKLLLVVTVLLLAAGITFFVSVCRERSSASPALATTRPGFQKLDFSCGAAMPDDEEELVHRV